jgi:hypothetical protein
MCQINSFINCSLKFNSNTQNKQLNRSHKQTNKQTKKKREKHINHKLNSPPISFEFVDNVSNGVVLCVSVSVCVCMCVSIESEYMCVY